MRYYKTHQHNTHNFEIKSSDGNVFDNSRRSATDVFIYPVNHLDASILYPCHQQKSLLPINQV